jgi:hypothetical protein
VNFGIFVLTLCAFSVFLRYWLAMNFRAEASNKRRLAVALAFSTFLFISLDYIGLALVTPDLCVAAIAVLASGVVCRLTLPGSSWKHYMALGGILGAGYYVKAVVFPLGLVLMAFLFLFPPSSSVRRKLVLVSFSTWLIVSLPLVALVSQRLGKLSFGDAGRLNYAWLVDDFPLSGWTGNTAGVQGVPEHAPRKLMDKPVVLEFVFPIKGTFPIWYEPSYWYAGVKVGFDLSKEIKALSANLRALKDLCAQPLVFVLGAVALWFLGRTLNSVPVRSQWWHLAWPLTAIAMYAVVKVEKRYVGPFFLLLWLGIYGPLIASVSRRVAAVVCTAVVMMVAVPITISSSTSLLSSLAGTDARFSALPVYQAVGLRLRNAGLQDGDRLAVVGPIFDPFYARFARLRVVAEIPDENAFWNLSASELDSVTRRLGSIGVKALVVCNRPLASAAADWEDVRTYGSQRFSILLLKP